jgi:ribosome assembly protein YihI (activator of Der GTPase)
MLLSHAALVRLHYRHVAWRIHASFLKSMSIEQTIPEELEAMLAIASQRAARLKPGLKAGRRLRASSLQQAMSPSTLKLPTLRSKGATSPVAQRLTEQANQRRRKLKDGYQAQQQELELLKEQNQLLENLNRQQAKALVIAKGSSDGRTRGLEYGGWSHLRVLP